jgi:hypothetical protein
MKVTGHKTESVYWRDAIVAESVFREAGASARRDNLGDSPREPSALAPPLLAPVPMTSTPSPARWSHAGAVGTAGRNLVGIALSLPVCPRPRAPGRLRSSRL